MNREDEKYYEKIVTLTAYPEWGDYVEELKKEIYQIQAEAFEAKNWDEFNVKKGEAKGLSRIVNLRADTINVMNIGESNES